MSGLGAARTQIRAVVTAQGATYQYSSAIMQRRLPPAFSYSLTSIA
jgi:hypothetical protein